VTFIPGSFGKGSKAAVNFLRTGRALVFSGCLKLSPLFVLQELDFLVTQIERGFSATALFRWSAMVRDLRSTSKGSSTMAICLGGIRLRHRVWIDGAFDGYRVVAKRLRVDVYLDNGVFRFRFAYLVPEGTKRLGTGVPCHPR
jgi:hypothetical protein